MLLSQAQQQVTNNQPVLLLPELPIPEDVYDIDSFELKELEIHLQENIAKVSACAEATATELQWLKKARKIADLVSLEVEERSAIEKFGQFCQQEEDKFFNALENPYSQSKVPVEEITKTQQQQYESLTEVKSLAPPTISLRDSALSSSQHGKSKKEMREFIKRTLDSTRITDPQHFHSAHNVKVLGAQYYQQQQQQQQQQQATTANKTVGEYTEVRSKVREELESRERQRRQLDTPYLVIGRPSASYRYKPPKPQNTGKKSSRDKLSSNEEQSSSAQKRRNQTAQESKRSSLKSGSSGRATPLQSQQGSRRTQSSDKTQRRALSQGSLTATTRQEQQLAASPRASSQAVLDSARELIERKIQETNEQYEATHELTEHKQQQLEGGDSIQDDVSVNKTADTAPTISIPNIVIEEELQVGAQSQQKLQNISVIAEKVGTPGERVNTTDEVPEEIVETLVQLQNSTVSSDTPEIIAEAESRLDLIKNQIQKEHKYRLQESVVIEEEEVCEESMALRQIQKSQKYSDQQLEVASKAVQEPYSSQKTEITSRAVQEPYSSQHKDNTQLTDNQKLQVRLENIINALGEQSTLGVELRDRLAAVQKLQAAYAQPDIQRSQQPAEEQNNVFQQVNSTRSVVTNIEPVPKEREKITITETAPKQLPETANGKQSSDPPEVAPKQQANIVAKVKATPPPRAPQTSVSNKMIERMMRFLKDEELVDYSQQIPTFYHLFSAFYNNNNGSSNNSINNSNNNNSNNQFQPGSMVDAMRDIYTLFQQHVERVDATADQTVFRYRTAVTSLDITPAESYYLHDARKVLVYSNRVGIDLKKFVERQVCLTERLQSSGNLTAAEALFYRVVRNKQEVYDIITRTFLRRQGWYELPHGLALKTSWNLLWTWSKPQIDLNRLLYFQKLNHFAFNKNLARKDLLKKNVERVQRLGTKAAQAFHILPSTYLLPKEYCQFSERFYEDRQREGDYNIWIMKPIGKSRGRGISLVSDLSEVVYAEQVVVQKYLKNPLLLRGHKFDMRIYVLVTSVKPLEAFLYSEGFARLSTEPFSLDPETLKNAFIHLTNYAIQKNNLEGAGAAATGGDAFLGGSKITLRMLRDALWQQKSIAWADLWRQVEDICLKTLIACQHDMPNNPNSFEIFGYDIIIDDNLKCWLLEVNSSPSLARDFIIDDLVKQQMVDDAIDLVDAPFFDRARLLEVLERRIREEQGQKSNINTTNNSKLQLNRDLNYILHSKPLRRVGEMPQKLGGFTRIAPSDASERLFKLVKSYKVATARDVNNDGAQHTTID